MTVLFDVQELLKEKKAHPEWIFFLGDKEKNPQTIMGKWKEITKQSFQELEDLVKRTEQRTDVEAWNWGIRTGINDVACLDFDWEFIFYRWLRKYRKRSETAIYKTANKGFRVIFRTT